jgi:hypothetical protein
MAEMAEKGKVDIATWEKVKAMVRNMLMSMWLYICYLAILGCHYIN